jgi:protein-L-isoaspartate O-methyltransferase
MSIAAERLGTASKAIAAFADAIRYRHMETYEPAVYERPAHVLSRYSAWRGLEYVIRDIITRFDVKTDACLEFGVEFGFSTVVLANYFAKVVGVDLFTGDVHAGLHDDHFASTAASLAAYPNIQLAQADYRDWIRTDTKTYDLIHVDIIHTYAATFECGLWSAQRSRCTLFHDTESFPEVKRAVAAIARKTNKRFYNFPLYYGLGIVAP